MLYVLESDLNKDLNNWRDNKNSPTINIYEKYQPIMMEDLLPFSKVSEW